VKIALRRALRSVIGSPPVAELAAVLHLDVSFIERHEPLTARPHEVSVRAIMN
jgi:hypothetical protein